MAGITLEQAEASLATWVAADAAVATGQSYSIGNRSLSRADAAAITDKIKFWNEQVAVLSRNVSRGGRIRYAVNS